MAKLKNPETPAPRSANVLRTFVLEDPAPSLAFFEKKDDKAGDDCKFIAVNNISQGYVKYCIMHLPPNNTKSLAKKIK